MSGVDTRPRTGAAARRGSFEELFAGHSPRLVGQLYLVTGDLTEAQDCVQEAFARAWMRWGEVADHPDPVAWVRLTAVRLATSRFRSRLAGLRAWGRLSRVTPTTDPPPTADTLALLAALRQIPTAQRVAVVLHHLVGMPVAEVARQVGVAEGTVKARLSRGRAALALLLQEEDGDE